METVNKQGEIICTKPLTVSHTKFLKVMKPFKKIRAGVGGGKKPFVYIYLKTEKKDVTMIVRMQQMKVTYSIMYNSKVNHRLQDVLYIHKMRSTLMDN